MLNKLFGWTRLGTNLSSVTEIKEDLNSTSKVHESLLEDINSYSEKLQQDRDNLLSIINESRKTIEDLNKRIDSILNIPYSKHTFSIGNVLLGITSEVSDTGALVFKLAPISSDETPYIASFEFEHTDKLSIAQRNAILSEIESELKSAIKQSIDGNIYTKVLKSIDEKYSNKIR